MKISLLYIILILISCSKQKLTLDGNWKLNIEIDNEQIPVVIELNQNKNKVEGFLVNSNERLELKGSISENIFELDVGPHYAMFRGELSREGIKGNWIRTNKKNYLVPFTGIKFNKSSLYEVYENSSSLIDVNGKWKVELGDEKIGLGLFKQRGSRVQGSILTQTGDYRFLDGYIENDKVTLTGFDGVFAFKIYFTVSRDKFIGKMHAGKSSVINIKAIKDDSFKLIDPTKMAELTSSKPVSLKLNSIEDKEINFSKGDYKGKAKVIQLFGSWCPNCVDETRFLKEWREKNSSKKDSIKFILLAFERADSKITALKNLKKAVSKLGVDYSVVLADFDQSNDISKFLPIKKILAFPTTVYINRKNEIVKIHTGFAGQATEFFFDEFVKDFNSTIDVIIK